MNKLSMWKTMFLLCVFCALGAIRSPAQGFTTLVNFDGADGARPFFFTHGGSLIQGTDGSLYGTTPLLGANNAYGCGTYFSLPQCGTVFKITPGGALGTLHNFCSQENCTDGATPAGGLVLATDGNLYGTTVNGGAIKCWGYGCGGWGSIFKITLGGTLTTLHSFQPCADGNTGCFIITSPDGSNPNTSLVEATDGNLYGTTSYGGAKCAINCGTVFKITRMGALTTLHSFDLTDGGGPSALIQATDGYLYGTTTQSNGPGTVFKMSLDGTLVWVYQFCSQANCPDGDLPLAPLVQGIDGNLYGTTAYGGADGGGTVFEVTPGGTLTTLYSFCAEPYCHDGARPVAGLVQGTDGNFYGETTQAGPDGGGTVFSITSGGRLTTLYSFCSQTGCTDGRVPYGTLVQATDGTFYGTTTVGGADGYGTVFSLSVGLGPFVKTLPTFGWAGKAVIILGNNLTGATGVSFNGTAATFTVVSDTEIETTVPLCATTGIVQVTTPSGTLESNVPFRVTPPVTARGWSCMLPMSQ